MRFIEQHVPIKVFLSTFGNVARVSLVLSKRMVGRLLVPWYLVSSWICNGRGVHPVTQQCLGNSNKYSRLSVPNYRYACFLLSQVWSAVASPHICPGNANGIPAGIQARSTDAQRASPHLCQQVSVNIFTNVRCRTRPCRLACIRRLLSLLLLYKPR